MENKNLKKINMDAYDGNAVRKNQQLEVPEREQYEYIRSTVTEKTRKRPQVRVSQGMDLFSLLVLIAAIAATFIICFRYLQIRADIVDLEKKVSGMSSQYNKQLMENNAMEDALASNSVDLDYVYQTAVGTLGMVFPNHNTVYYYSGENDSFYHQYGEIPE